MVVATVVATVVARAAVPAVPKEVEGTGEATGGEAMVGARVEVKEARREEGTEVA